MLPALLHGKLSRDQENMEDILTSNVFGLLQYLAPHDGLIPFIVQATTLDGQAPLANLTAVADVKVGYTYWPMWSESGCTPCEPDVVLTIRAPGIRDLIVLVEAKFYSGKSSEASAADKPPYDQLAREWDNLVHVAKRKHADPILIYLTADAGLPHSEITASLKEYTAKRSDGPKPVIAWLSWCHLRDVVKGSSNPIKSDLDALLTRLGLIFYEGIHDVKLAAPDLWTYKPPALHFSWGDDIIKYTGPWRFTA